MNNSPVIIQATLIVDQLYNDIKQRIIRGDLKGDQKLSVRELKEYYGVSDTPVKQALNRLVTEQFVVSLPRCGMRVRQISKQDIYESIEARMMMELFAVPFALEKAKNEPSFLKALECNLRNNEKLLQKPELLSHYSEKAMQELSISLDFHRIIVNAIGNSMIMNSYDSIVNHQYVYFQQQMDKSSELLASFQEHKQIFACLCSGDEIATREAIIRHRTIRRQAACSALDK